MTAFRTLGALLLVAALALPSASFTVFRTQGGRVTKWPTPQVVKWYLANEVLDDVNEDALQVSLQAAFDAWEEVSCASLSFRYEGRRSSHPGDGIFVRFETSQWDPAATDVLAYGPSEWNGAGTIQSAEVIFNAVDASWTTVAIVPQGKSDIQGVATHEIGHTLGIGHSRSTTQLTSSQKTSFLTA